MSARLTTGLLLLLACAPCACTHGSVPTSTTSNTENSIASFLKNAERQTETDEQRREVQRALHDMLEKSPGELRAIRYADYAGQANKWSVIQLLQHYFVPNPPSTLDEARFFEEVGSPQAREAIQRQLEAVNHALQ